MNVKLDPDLLKKLKKVNVRIRNRFKERILLFSKNPHDSLLSNTYPTPGVGLSVLHTFLYLVPIKSSISKRKGQTKHLSLICFLHISMLYFIESNPRNLPFSASQVNGEHILGEQRIYMSSQKIQTTSQFRAFRLCNTFGG